ncbi:MAG: GNAT family N-acetyltransferase [Hyphomicrobium sp.]|nr:GNAT family N-acetyltransferase [Hyphomicrobium sp.]
MRHAASTDTLLGRELAKRHVTVHGKDGATYLLRPIAASDAASLIRGYDAMSDDSKWYRMLNTVPHLSVAAAQKFCSPDPERELCVVVEGRGELQGEILGGARIAGEADDRTAEFSVSLRPEAQGLGLAHRALEMALEEAREMGYEAVWGLIARSNEPMLRLARRIGFKTSTCPDDIALVRAEIRLMQQKR